MEGKHECRAGAKCKEIRATSQAHLEWVFSTMVGCIQDLVDDKGSSLSVVTGPRGCGRPSPRPNIPRAPHYNNRSLTAPVVASLEAHVRSFGSATLCLSASPIMFITVFLQGLLQHWVTCNAAL